MPTHSHAPCCGRPPDDQTSPQQMPNIHAQQADYPTFKQMKAFLDLDSPDYGVFLNYAHHIHTNNLALFPDFACNMGRHVHIVDIRSDIQFKLGYIPNSNWFPSTSAAQNDEDALVETISKQFDKTMAISIVCSNGVFSRRVAMKLRRLGHGLCSVFAGGIRLYKIFGFSLNHNVSLVMQTPNQPRSVMKLHDLVTDDIALTVAARQVYEKRLKEQVIGLPAEQHEEVQDDVDFNITQSVITEQVARHVSNELQWCKMAALSLHAKISCIDGRGSDGCIGTPGGDTGAFLLVLSQYESLTGAKLTQQQVQMLFAKRLDNFGRFYLHTDETSASKALKAIKDALPADVIHAIKQEVEDEEEAMNHGFRHFVSKITNPEHQQKVVEILINPNHIGCGHIKLIMLHSAQYGVRRELVEYLLTAFYQFVFWSLDMDNTDCDYVVLSGTHNETGILSVQFGNEVRPYTKIPLISPAVITSQGSRQMFVNHPSVLEYLRRQQCDWLVETIDHLNADALAQRKPQQLKPFTTTALRAFSSMVELYAEKHAGATCGYLAPGLPVYNLQFDVEHSSCKVHLAGFIEKEEEEPQGLVLPTSPRAQYGTPSHTVQDNKNATTTTPTTTTTTTNNNNSSGLAELATYHQEGEESPAPDMGELRDTLIDLHRAYSLIQHEQEHECQGDDPHGVDALAPVEKFEGCGLEVSHVLIPGFVEDLDQTFIQEEGVNQE